jgi:hypothetical protein
MPSIALQEIAEAVVRRARLQGSVAAGDIREELTRAGGSPNLWRDVLALARPSLRYRGRRYHYAPPAGEKLPAEPSHQQRIRDAVHQLIRQHREGNLRVDRRAEERVPFFQSVRVRTEDDREYMLLSRDISLRGIRLVGKHSLLGKRVRVLIPRPGDGASCGFLVRILWTCAIGEDLFENGGMFLEMES